MYDKESSFFYYFYFVFVIDKVGYFLLKVGGSLNSRIMFSDMLFRSYSMLNSNYYYDFFVLRINVSNMRGNAFIYYELYTFSFEFFNYYILYNIFDDKV